MLPIQEKGIYKVVDVYQLEQMTSSGWRLVAVLDNQSPMKYETQETIAVQPTYAGGPTSMFVNNSRYHDVKGQMFLVMRDEESAIATLKQVIAELNEKLVKMTATEKLAETHQKTADELAANLKKVTESYALALEQTKAERSKLESYEKEVADWVKTAKEIIDRDSQRRRTAYERVTEGEYDDGVESIEERDVR